MHLDRSGWTLLSPDEVEFLQERGFHVTFNAVGDQIAGRISASHEGDPLVSRHYFGARFLLDCVLAPWGGDPVYQMSRHAQCPHQGCNHKRIPSV